MFTIENICKATSGEIVQQGLPRIIKGISIDSRSLKEGEAFIAIRGDRFDGHQFVPKAVQKKASAIVISRKDIKFPQGITVIRVEDTTKALGQIAAYHRAQFNIPVIAVTGSAGKTTTKEMIAAILRTKYKVLKNQGTENNQFGVPLTLLKLSRFHEMVIVELGTNRPGDIPWLSQIVCPRVVVLTNIGESHLELLKNPDGVFQEKMQMVTFMQDNGMIVFNGDDSYLRKISKMPLSQKKVSYALNTPSDFHAKNLMMTKHKQIEFELSKEKFRLKSPVRHNVYNALAAICCGRIFGIDYHQIREGLLKFKFNQHRQELKKIGRFWIIDDTYNSNPVSFRSAIHTIDTFQTKGRRILICADMLELGERTKESHQSIAERVANSSINFVLTIGDHAQEVFHTIKRLDQNIQAFHFRVLADMHKCLKRICLPGDTILIKGSRKMRMERTVDFLERMLRGSS